MDNLQLQPRQKNHVAGHVKLNGPLAVIGRPAHTFAVLASRAISVFNTLQ